MIRIIVISLLLLSVWSVEKNGEMATNGFGVYKMEIYTESFLDGDFKVFKEEQSFIYERDKIFMIGNDGEITKEADYINIIDDPKANGLQFMLIGNLRDTRFGIVKVFNMHWRNDDKLVFEGNATYVNDESLRNQPINSVVRASLSGVISDLIRVKIDKFLQDKK